MKISALKAVFLETAWISKARANVTSPVAAGFSLRPPAFSRNAGMGAAAILRQDTFLLIAGKLLIFFTFTVLLPILAYAELEVSNTPLPELAGLDYQMALDLRDMDIVDVLKFLARKGDMNIVASKEVTGRVSLFLREVSIKDALEIVLLANNLAYERKGDIIFVMTEVEYKALHGTDFKDRRQVRTVELKYARPDYAFEILKTLKSDIGKLAIDDESGVIVMLDTPEYLESMLDAVKKIDQPGITKVFTLQYAKAEDVQATLAGKLDAKKVGSIIADTRSNQVIVRALADRMSEIESLIKDLDRKTKEVLLEAKIIKVTLSDDFEMGIEWERLFNDAYLHGLDFVGSFPISSTVTSFGKMTIGTLNNDDYTATLKALQTYGETKNLSSPSIAVVNNQEARIHIGTREAYVTSTTTTGQATSTTAEQVTFLDVGVKLTVIPTINDEDFVTMKVKAEVSHVSRMYKTPTKNEIPIVDTTESESTVMVKDGTTIVIGGLRKDEKKETVNKLPILGSIPILGLVFSQTQQETEKTELVIFLTPHIISGAVDAVDEEMKPKPIREYEQER